MREVDVDGFIAGPDDEPGVLLRYQVRIGGLRRWRSSGST